MENLVISVLGNRNSGKSETWNTLFGKTVKTGKSIRQLNLTNNEIVDVFLVSGSPEERETYVGNIIGQEKPRIVLCSMQYRADVINTIRFFEENNYHFFCQWLNPGYQDENEDQMEDNLGIMNHLMAINATISIKSGKEPSTNRVQKIKEFLYGWAFYNNLIKKI